MFPANDPIATIHRMPVGAEVAGTVFKLNADALFLASHSLAGDAIRETSMDTLDVKLHPATQLREKKHDAQFVCGCVTEGSALQKFGLQCCAGQVSLPQAG